MVLYASVKQSLFAALHAERNRLESLLPDATDWEAFASQLVLVAGHQLHGDAREYFGVHSKDWSISRNGWRNFSLLPRFVLFSPRLVGEAEEHNGIRGKYLSGRIRLQLTD
jgi:hypothetical protein